MPWPIYPRERDLVPIVSEAGWAPGLVWTGTENLASTRIQSPDHPARSELLHHLHYAAHLAQQYGKKIHTPQKSNVNMLHCKKQKIFTNF